MTLLQTKKAMNNDPFFILGAPRSGTTLLRDFLRLHPRLACPEETHIFRWGDPFGTHMYERHYKGSQLFRKHREMDGVDNFICYLDASLH